MRHVEAKVVPRLQQHDIRQRSFLNPRALTPVEVE